MFAWMTRVCRVYGTPRVLGAVVRLTIRSPPPPPVRKISMRLHLGPQLSFNARLYVWVGRVGLAVVPLPPVVSCPLFKINPFLLASVNRFIVT